MVRMTVCALLGIGRASQLAKTTTALGEQRYNVWSAAWLVADLLMIGWLASAASHLWVSFAVQVICLAALFPAVIRLKREVRTFFFLFSGYYQPAAYKRLHSYGWLAVNMAKEMCSDLTWRRRFIRMRTALMMRRNNSLNLRDERDFGHFCTRLETLIADRVFWP